MPVTYYVALPFVRTEEGIAAGQGQEWPSEEIGAVQRELHDRVDRVTGQAADQPEEDSRPGPVPAGKHPRPHQEPSRTARRPASRLRSAVPNAAATVTSKISPSLYPASVSAPRSASLMR
jgi:hypothetical protein